jgi:hypothetical protein
VDVFGGWTTVFTCYLRGEHGGEAFPLPSMTMILGGMVQQGLDGRCGMMDAHAQGSGAV